MRNRETKLDIEKIKSWFLTADALLITSGAGMGVDSGLPDFRGEKGFWKAYPMYERLGIQFMDAANPRHFSKDPHFGWGFYGHRLNLYRKTKPHRGFSMLQSWCDRFGLDFFVVTSNVDGQFQKAGFPQDRIYEIHGSIHHLQCTAPCSSAIWDNDLNLEIDLDQMRSVEVPRCQSCGRVARPNILMFGDYFWVSDRSDSQEDRFSKFMSDQAEKNILVVEIGAGTALPTIRHLSESIGYRYQNAKVIRINPREAEISQPHFSLSYAGLEGLKWIDSLLTEQEV